MPMINEAAHCYYEKVADARSIDQIMKLGMGHPIGPLKLADLIGIYVCVCCGHELFDSNAKFNSGCGWPSYSSPVDKSSLIELEDNSHGMIRTEVKCSVCDAHLGHVFEDGPAPNGLRYCINSLSVIFKKRP